MILVLNKDISPQQDARLTAYLEGLGLTATRQLCQGKTILLLSGPCRYRPDRIIS